MMGNHVGKLALRWLRGECLFIFGGVLYCKFFMLLKYSKKKNLNESTKTRGELYQCLGYNYIQIEHMIQLCLSVVNATR